MKKIITLLLLLPLLSQGQSLTYIPIGARDTVKADALISFGKGTPDNVTIYVVKEWRGDLIFNYGKSPGWVDIDYLDEYKKPLPPCIIWVVKERKKELDSWADPVAVDSTVSFGQIPAGDEPYLRGSKGFGPVVFPVLPISALDTASFYTTPKEFTGTVMVADINTGQTRIFLNVKVKVKSEKGETWWIINGKKWMPIARRYDNGWRIE